MREVSASRTREALDEEILERPRRIGAGMFLAAAAITAVLVAAIFLSEPDEPGAVPSAGGGFSAWLDQTARAAGISVARVDVVGLESQPKLRRMVRLSAMIEPGENMFRADPRRIRERVLASGQVGQARVYRLWPDQIVIRVEPAHPSALWYDGEAWQVVDSLGRVMQGLQAPDYEALPRVSGRDAAVAVPGLMRALAETAELRDRLSYAQRISGQRWDLTLSNGVTAQMPADESLTRAMQRLAALDKDVRVTSKAVETIDLRVPGKVYLNPQSDDGAESAGGGL